MSENENKNPKLLDESELNGVVGGHISHQLVNPKPYPKLFRDQTNPNQKEEV
jgi:hypothetical protein